MNISEKDFIERWKNSGGSERANYQLFLAELCDLLGTPRPEPAKPANIENAYVFERGIRFTDGEGETKTNYLDLYKRGCFVCETKQGVEQAGGQDLLSATSGDLADYTSKGHGKRGTGGWDKVMKRARSQGERYIRALPTTEGRPPFLLVVDVGYVIEVYSEFSCTGGNYTPFPEARTHRIQLEQLSDPAIRQRLKAIWEEPLSLDPAKYSAAITREIAGHLASLAKSLEADGHAPEVVSGFLMRCLFTMFSEDTGLLPNGSFTQLLTSHRDDPAFFVASMEQLWDVMNKGGQSLQLREKLLQFNGGLFADNTALALNSQQLDFLIQAAKADWTYVEPAIFGTLLERALDPVERHKLGAHYTPREYVERLVLPTIIDPLRQDWANTEVAATRLEDNDDHDGAVDLVTNFLSQLCQIKVLDPACGTGNFLYVTLEHLKRLEGEVLDALNGMGATQTSFEMRGITVDPHQLLGLEINPRAVAIADIVLWIGYLQWHFRTHGNVTPPEPVLRNFHNIQHRDALMEWDSVERVLSETGEPVTHWDGRTTKPHPVTGKEVPDDTARIPEVRYLEPRRASWPEADFIVGNPPFIGTSRMRDALGDGYTEAVRQTYSELPESCDFVMYWWHKAAELARQDQVRQFGFIATNSLRQTFNRRVIEPHLGNKNPMSIVWAIPDHPWVDSADGAAVRISMTVGQSGERDGLLNTVVDEKPSDGHASQVVLLRQSGALHSNLTVGVNTTASVSLTANRKISSRGVSLHGSGFIVTEQQAQALGLGTVSDLDQHIRKYRNGRDLTQSPRGVRVIDLFGLSAEEVRHKFPAVYQHIREHVWPERRENNRASYRDNWWVFGEPRRNFRPALADLTRYIATVETTKHRVFQFLDQDILPDNMLVNIALDDAHFLGVLSSRIHVIWSLASGGTLEDRPRYNKTRCLETFPFPDATDIQRDIIRRLAEQLDQHRKRQQEMHPKLKLTDMYNVLEKLRSGEALTINEKKTHEWGLVSVLKDFHDELDAAVADAYGWPEDLTDDEILGKLVALNAERSAEECQGIIRWLRPKYQNQDGEEASQQEMAATAQQIASPTKKKKLPADLPGRVAAIRTTIANMPAGGTAEGVAASYSRANRKAVQEILETLSALGQLQSNDGELFFI